MWITIAYLAGVITGFAFCVVIAYRSSNSRHQRDLDQGTSKPFNKKDGPQPPRTPVTFALILIPLLIIASGCLATNPPDPEVIERHCALVDLKDKPEIPAVEWIEHNGLRCLDDPNYNNLKQGFSLIKTHGNYCIRVYEGAQERCKE